MSEEEILEFSWWLLQYSKKWSHIGIAKYSKSDHFDGEFLKIWEKNKNKDE